MHIRTTAAALAIIGLLALPAGAIAGGWAMVGLSSTPDGLKPGQPWDVESAAPLRMVSRTRG